MSVVALTTRPARPGRTDRVLPPRPRTGPTLTVTLDLGAGPLTPGLARLVELLDELATAGEDAVHPDGHRAAPAVLDLRRVAARPAEPRETPAEPPPATPDLSGGLRILTGTRRVRHGGVEVALTRIEYDLLLFLAEHPRRVFTRRQLLANVWGYEHAVARTVDVHIRRLRAKFGPDTPLVTTVYGVGYRLADDAPIEVDRDA
ncbi:winged helix-turn-helix domain-containing protein [Micromonospora sp. WMMD1128]|uniref:winged helix-turn-helix domain-containing protein n=1 Tax=unclassified Micromonospora TaxID=2617518 RepID=UPI00248B4A1C|nr:MULTISPECIES: winged helix-turn-helix domain-containing protein [unclassified Micromonospora]WBB76799.1 winged helix-turn-helix domain-containing protein [Micromonospora sp. WMMD1128]WFE35417.1 winged helix-turn-helix domain-containing protein [Micromonospora sp. WMMD975]